MKTLVQYLLPLFFTVVLSSAFYSCSKKIEEANLQYPLLQPLNIDTNAGTWKPILLTSASEFTCPAPLATTSPDFTIQLNEIKSYQASTNKTDAAILAYWGAGAVLRWNEIMRELVAKHNIPPYQNADGTYPVPSATNPLAYPTFPFANPPYAARAYCYLSTAQYDALVAAYYYKMMYNRKAPYYIDTKINCSFPKSNLPSYPSEDATVLGVSVEILKLLFPGDQDYIDQKAQEHRRARILSGANVRNDIEAGEALGKLVAAKFIARARTDKAGAAVGNSTLWEQLKQNAINKGETPWISQENPARPPMLPLFGNVKAFLFDSTLLATNIRPVAPPSTNSQQFKEELNEIKKISTTLTKEQIKIAEYWSDGVRTYTPPGHWNYIASNDFVQAKFSEVRWARNMALLNMSLMDAAIACWHTKYYYFNPRPMQVDPSIKTCIGLPNFPSYISGHSTFSGAAATILRHIIPSKQTEYNAMAKEASDSRMYGCIHYKSDCKLGLETGGKIGQLAVQRAVTDGAE